MATNPDTVPRTSIEYRKSNSLVKTAPQSSDQSSRSKRAITSLHSEIDPTARTSDGGGLGTGQTFHSVTQKERRAVSDARFIFFGRAAKTVWFGPFADTRKAGCRALPKDCEPHSRQGAGGSFAWTNAHSARTTTAEPGEKSVTGEIAMKRVILAILCLTVSVPVLCAQSAEERKVTVAYLQGLQTADGGFLPAVHDTGGSRLSNSSLRSTSSALRALKYFGGAPKDKKAAADFVAKCFDKESGGFVDHPRGKPDVTTTAIGIMAVVEVKLSTEPYSDGV